MIAPPQPPLPLLTLFYCHLVLLRQIPHDVLLVEEHRPVDHLIHEDDEQAVPLLLPPVALASQEVIADMYIEIEGDFPHKTAVHVAKDDTENGIEGDNDVLDDNLTCLFDLESELDFDFGFDFPQAADVLDVDEVAVEEGDMQVSF